MNDIEFIEQHCASFNIRYNGTSYMIDALTNDGEYINTYHKNYLVALSKLRNYLEEKENN